MRRMLSSLLIMGSGFCANNADNTVYSFEAAPLQINAAKFQTAVCLNITSHLVSHETSKVIAERILQEPKIQGIAFFPAGARTGYCFLEPILNVVFRAESEVSYLGLKSMNLNDYDLALMAPALGRCQNPNLTVDLTGNPFTEKSITNISAALKRGNGKLKGLILGEKYDELISIGLYLGRGVVEVIEEES